VDDRNDDHYVYHDLNLYKHKTVIVEEEKTYGNLYRYIITQASGNSIIAIMQKHRIIYELSP